MKIRIKSCDSAKARALNERFKLPLLAATVMARRNMGEEDVVFSLENDILYQHSPFTVEDVYSAVERIEEALDEEERGEQEKILIFGDRDVDGVTSTAIMMRTLKKLGAKNVSYRLPHGDESYGITKEGVKEILEGGYSLVITVDNGISAREEIKELMMNGVDVIILDHHIPGEKLPPATAIFDPKVEGSGYPFPHLAGCAVAAKLCWALHFASTPLWNSRVILLHAEPGNGTIRVSGAKMENMMVVDTCSDEFLEGEKNSLSRSRLLPFLACGLPVIVLDKDTELSLLRRAFGNNVDIALEDFRPQLDRIMPKTRGKSLFDLSLLSRSARYVTANKEMETLISLFKSASIYAFPSLTKDFEDMQQLEAIGTISDLMPMVDENRIIVRKGLSLMSKKPLPCLSYLLAKQNLIGKPISAVNVSFKISPVLNAAGRMGEPETALELLLTDEPGKIEDLTDRLLSLNAARQQNEEDTMKMVSSKAEDSYIDNDGKIVIIDDPSVPRGLTGSIASRISNDKRIPVIVLATMDGKVSGSMRCHDPWSARDFLSSFSHLLEDYGGHRFAAGFRLDEEKKAEFIARVEEYVREIPEESEESREIEVDAQIPKTFMNEELWEIRELFEPFGQENEELLFYIPDCEIVESFSVGGNPKYMKFTIRYGNSQWPAVWWDARNNNEFHPGRHVSVVFTPETNWWKGVGKRQLGIREMEPLP